MHTPLSYAQAGVDIDAGNRLVQHIKPLAAATRRAGVMGGIGGFGALFDIRALGMEDPILVSTTDGVGTKLKIAQETNIHDTIGIDLVAMCVNDLLVQAAEPLFFLDYFATGTLSVETAATVISGIAQGCRQSGCALVGGETAEMPGMYAPGEYDLAGFTVGAVERSTLLPRDVALGDVILGIASSGVHSNGYSLVRKIVERSGVPWGDAAPFAPGQTLARALLTPTKIYVQSLLPLLRRNRTTHDIHALAHITGGGLLENIPRILPENMAATLHTDRWVMPPVFAWLQAQGGVQMQEMYRTFNCGIGMVMIVRPEAADALRAELEQVGETVFAIGQVTTRTRDGVIMA